MKISIFILSLVVLWLSCIPCSDKMNVGNTGFKSLTATQHSKKDQHTDCCSPFCSCSCCTAAHFTIQEFSIDELTYNPFSIPAISIFIDIIEVSLPVWQPPQLSA